jgi:hypothetical protein
MRNLKKLLAVIVAICVLATFTIPAFAETTTTKTDAQLCQDLGMIFGSGGGVTDEYLSSQPDRLQGAIMLLRLKGLEDTAKAFLGTDNFSDVAGLSATNKAITAYLKANPDLGFVGSDGKIMPTEKMTAKQYYSVMLTALGYSSPADYTWDTLLSVAAAKGLTKLIDNTKFTVNDLCVGTIEALKTKVKDGSSTLLEALAKADADFAAKAQAAGLYTPAPVNVTVASVSADNLKQVVVAFTGAVDKDSAESKDNYSIDSFSFDSAKLAADGKTVTLSLAQDEAVKFENQKEYKITVDGVKDASGKTIAKADKVAFVPVDNTIPTVTEVTALGTKALKVVYSEPIKGTSAATTAAYKIDGKSIAGSVKYNFPNSVIITTTMTTGEHKLSVDNVADYSGFLKVSAKDIAFTVAEDTAAPEIVSAKAVDLMKVEVIFNEPVKAVSKAYHTSSSKTAKTPYGYDDTKVTLEFTTTNKLSIGATTVTLENVEDYSGNKATRTVEVTPTLDTERPTVTAVKVEKDGESHKFTVSFSESVKADNDADNAAKGANYVFKDKDGKVVTGKGLNSKGSPANSYVSYDNAKKQSIIKLPGLLDAGDYTLEISGIQDTAYVANMMLPYTYSFTIGDTKAPTVSKKWAETTSPVSGKYDSAIFIQFSEEMAVEGNGNVLDRTKYNYSIDSGSTWKTIPSDATLELVTSDTLKITFPRSDSADMNLQAKGSAVKVRITLVSDVAGNFLASNANYIEIITLDTKGSISITNAKATAKDTISVEFDGILTNINAGDFRVLKPDPANPTTPIALEVSLESYTTKDGKTTAIFNLKDEDKLGADAGVTTAAVKTYSFSQYNAEANIATQDSFGRKVAVTAKADISDEIRPESVDYTDTTSLKQSIDVIKSTTSGIYTVKVKFDENIDVRFGGSVKEVIAVKVGGTEVQVDTISADGRDLVLVLALNADKKLIKTDNSAYNDTIDSDTSFEVVLKEANDTTKVITDATGNLNAALPFVRSETGIRYVN